MKLYLAGKSQLGKKSVNQSNCSAKDDRLLLPRKKLGGTQYPELLKRVIDDSYGQLLKCTVE
jgi:hypothetical protein